MALPDGELTVAQRLGRALDRGLLPAGGPAEAAERLIQRLERVVAEASPGNRSCAITNRSPLTGQASRERFNRVVVQVRLRCGNPELAQVLHSLESGTPRLFVENLNVLAQRMYFAPGVRNPGEGGLDVSFDLYGYLPPSVEVSRAR